MTNEVEESNLNRAIAFRDPIEYAPRMKWIGFVLDWKQTYTFNGKPRECPQSVELHVWAANEKEAKVRLDSKAEELGYALGGVQNVMISANQSTRKTPLPKKKEKKEKVTKNEKEFGQSLRDAELLALLEANL